MAYPFLQIVIQIHFVYISLLTLFPDIEVNNFLIKRYETNFREVFIENKEALQLPLSNFGTGLINLMVFVTNLIINSENISILCIDEPENNLHPSLQKKFYNFLKEIAKERGIQIFISTQSTYFLDAFNIKNIYHIAIEDAQAKVFKCKTEIYENLRDLIRIINVKSTQFFFADKIILVEGLSDALVLSYFAKKLGHEFEAENILFLDIGGKDNFQKYKKLLESFGIKTFIIADCDFIIRGLEKILKDYDDNSTFKQQIQEIRQKLLEELDKEIQNRSTILKGKNYKKLISKIKGHKDKFHNIIGLLRKIHKLEHLEDDEINLLEYFIEFEDFWKKEKIVKEIDSKAKTEITRLLASENILILRKGELEDYYPEIPGTKNEKALKIIDTYDGNKIREIGKSDSQVVLDIVSDDGKITTVKSENEFFLFFEVISSRFNF